MKHESYFRLVLLVGFTTLVCVGLWYRIRSNTGEKLDRRQEGLAILVSLRLVALFCFAGLVTYMIRPQWMSWSSLAMPTWLRWLGALIGALSILLKTWTFQSLGKNLTDTVVTRERHNLVTHDPYRWIRHPFYTSFALDVVGISLMTTNWFLLSTGFIVFVILVIRTRREEEKLIERFGDGYKDYTRRVGRFFPRPM